MITKYNFIILLSLLLSNVASKAQTKTWSLLIDKEVARLKGYQIYEADSFYYVVGTSVDEFGKPEQGFSVSKVDKNNASIASTVHYEEPGVQFDFNQCRKGYLIDSLIYFPQTTVTLPASIQLFAINIHTLNIEKKLSLPPPDSTSRFTIFLSDFIQLDNTFFILAKYYIGENDNPNFKSVPFLIRYGIENDNHKVIEFIDDNKVYVNYQITSFKEGLLLMATIPGQLVATGKLVMSFLTNEGMLKWKYETPDLSPINNTRDIYVLNDKEIMFVSYDSEFSYSDFYLRSRWTVTKFDTENKKIIWSNHWNEPRKQEIWPGAKIIKGFRDNEYILMANDIVKTDTLYYGLGKLVKFNTEGKRIWQKTYYLNNRRGLSNEFNNIIATNDKNYLVVGDENLIQTAWLVKIDEDGNILPIDTISTAIDWSIPNKATEISIYPNPAASSIIINQGEIADVRYIITDMNGQSIQEITVASQHQNTLWDISDLPCGTYVITMMHDQKVIGQIRQVVVK